MHRQPTDAILAPVGPCDLHAKIIAGSRNGSDRHCIDEVRDFPALSLSAATFKTRACARFTTSNDGFLKSDPPGRISAVDLGTSSTLKSGSVTCPS